MELRNLTVDYHKISEILSCSDKAFCMFDLINNRSITEYRIISSLITNAFTHSNNTRNKDFIHLGKYSFSKDKICSLPFYLIYLSLILINLKNYVL